MTEQAVMSFPPLLLRNLHDCAVIPRKKRENGGGGKKQTRGGDVGLSNTLTGTHSLSLSLSTTSSLPRSAPRSDSSVSSIQLHRSDSDMDGNSSNVSALFRPDSYGEMQNRASAVV